MDLRPYSPADRDGCLAVFDSNTPQYFKAHERADFEKFLDRPDCSYLVMEHDGAICGCGGYSVADDKAARLVWGMVRRDLQRQGLGRFLLMYRLRELTKTSGVEMVSLDTSQHTAPFFERQGFKIMRIAKNGYADGLDRVEMVKRLSVCP
jgi:ribosomal protein S18 acetylase RimI-like enzyme